MAFRRLSQVDDLGFPKIRQSSVEASLFDYRGFRLKLTVQSSKIPGDLTNFPVYVDLSDLPSSFFSAVDADGGDIRVVTDTGIECPREIVTIDTVAETGEMHFLAPSVSGSSDTVFWIYYGSSEVSSYGKYGKYGTERVWEDYAFVFHVTEDDDPGSDVPNAQSSVGTAQWQARNMASGDLVTGKIGKGWDFDGSNDYTRMTLAPLIDVTTTWTFSAWVNTSSGASGSSSSLANPIFSCEDAAAMALGIDDGKVSVVGYEGSWSKDRASTGMADGNWHHVAFVQNGSTSIAMYLDGSSDGTSDNAYGYTYLMNYVQTIANMNGGTYFNGILDELRWAVKDLSANEVEATYNNQDDTSTFYAVA